ncbi:MAG: tyrosine-type recombinase/integrase [Eubacterium sp.]|nr:tyrosine-type recombinase/integrase [Eubacterium sp.]
MDYLNEFKNMISLRGLTSHTVTSYCTYISAYLDYIENTLYKSPEQVTCSEQRTFIGFLKESRGLSDRTVNCAISQIRFFTLYVLHKPWDPTQLPMRRFDTYLPYVPSQQEARTFIETIPDIKVKAMTALMYSSGLRVGEVCSLRYEDIQRRNKRIHIRHGKNRSDRYAILSDHALEILTEYWFACDRPTGWLFPKQTDPSRPIDTFFVSRHIHNHEKALGWPQRITCHTFRHAFGTHLYENGADLLTIKTLMGHKSINSTVVYVHLGVVSKNTPVSPFDLNGGQYA